MKTVNPPSIDQKTSYEPSLGMDDHAHFRITTAVVSSVEVNHFEVSNIQTLRADVAVSCLAVPQVGDMVLVAEALDQCWILSVLVHSGLRDLKMSAPHLVMDGINASMHFNQIKTSSQKLEATHGLIQLLSGRVNATVSAMEWVGQRITSLVDVVFNRNRQILREVSEIESIRSEHYDLQVNQVMSISTDTGLITGQGLVKLDAAQIQIG